jgi:hypothetical protein
VHLFQSQTLPKFGTLAEFAREKFIYYIRTMDRGIFITYAEKASIILEAPEIRRQIRNHWKILQETIDKYEFSNK